MPDPERRLRAHALPVAALFLLALLPWWSVLHDPEQRIDERDYFQAFAARAAGRSPYSVHRYLYTPAFAVAGAAAVEGLGERATLLLLRHLNLLGACAIVWASLALTAWRARSRFLLAMAAVVLAPIVRHGMLYGNITFVVVAASLLGLALADSRPALGGGLLGLGLAIKPLGAPAAVALALHRRPGATRRPLIVTAAAVAASALLPVLLLDGSRLPEMLARMGQPYEVTYNLSLAYVLHLFGLDVPPIAIAVVVLLGTLVVLWRVELDGRGLVLLGSTASLLALPLVWTHTLAWNLPAQALAAERAIATLRAAPDEAARRRARLVLGLVLVGIANVEGSAALVAVRHLPDPVLGLFVALPIALATALAIYAAGAPARYSK